MAGVVGTLAYEFQVTLPVVAKQTFGGNATTYGFLTAAMGFGAVFGGLFTATRGRTGLRTMTFAWARDVTLGCRIHGFDTGRRSTRRLGRGGAGARSGLAFGGLSCLVAAAIGLFAMRKLHRRRTSTSMSPRIEEAFDSLSPLVSAESD
jgi:Transmembrane secretion effector